MSDITKKLRLKSAITFWLSVALNVVPMLVFIIAGISTQEVEQKVVLSLTAMIAAVIGVIMLVSKAKLGRVLFWIVFLVMYICMNDLKALIITMGICTLLDDLVIKHLHHRWNEDYHTNKQIDKREA